ncbi:prepilin-type N-terminal cleavage/methylation domain-containing protein [Actinoplanes sp. NEAU-A12]|uniref:Prepilin-type N-terminal cleavage/methylation domain-containing protein n=1 Tax=Actinoplanes sandaracinus TaxID=3045177 RepID=A0ABT6WC81_9ACTN|nr:prepilin-type N-terminal cleavage/methylation domain-containing protein [Actinoplanes sandaracinus]MDI6097331.1 prepilin-type N-terminal cleavage/methylation domain-containing protein [Actinoplanes sandaracinus]
MTRPPRLPTSDDAGVTLVEVMTAMALSGVVMAIFTTAMIQVYRAVDATENVSVSQTQLHLVFRFLDREIRYASGVTEPNTTAVGGAWYVEFLGTDPAAGGPACHQLRLDGSGVLRQLTWTPGSPPGAGAAGRTLASNLALPGGTVAAPFTRLTPHPEPTITPTAGPVLVPDYQRLRVRLTARSGTATSQSDATFTALNTSRDTTEPSVCIEGRPVA